MASKPEKIEAAEVEQPIEAQPLPPNPKLYTVATGCIIEHGGHEFSEGASVTLTAAEAAVHGDRVRF